METNPLYNVLERRFIGRMMGLFKPPVRMTTREYAETRWLTSEVSAKPGKMDCLRTPYMLKVMELMDDIECKVIVARKSAQIAWSETQNSYIAKRMDLDPQNIIMAFPRLESAKSYSNEKIKPLIRSIPALLADIGDPDLCSFAFYKFTGGFLKLVTAGSATALKSTSAPILIVEEPDDLKEDLNNQGDALAIFMERQKTYEERKLIFGGTPKEEGFSKVDTAFNKSTKRIYMAYCYRCGNLHDIVSATAWQNLRYDPWQGGHIDKTYGRFNPATAHYVCPYCGAIWDDADKERGVLEALNYFDLGWKVTAESDIEGFDFSELLSSFPGSTLEALARKKLEAEHELTKGKEGLMKAFTNNSMGKAYAPKSSGIDVEKLKEKRINYPEKVCPIGGIIITAGIDVQHNRFSVLLRAWGRNGCSWLLYWGEIFGYTKDPEDPCWAALEMLMTSTIPYAEQYNGKTIQMPISAAGIDSGDGGMTEVIYNWVLYMKSKHGAIFATKGSSELGINAKEIFSAPAAPEANTPKEQRKALAERMGVTVYIIGTQLAKDEVLRKLTLTGVKDRSYHYLTVRDDYEEQLLSNVKRLSPTGANTRYELIAGRNDEALDCEVIALWATRAINLHLWQEAHWSQAERNLLQVQEKLVKPEQQEESDVTPGIGI